MNLNSQGLLEQIKSGDEKAYRQLFDEYYDDLCRFALMYAKDKDAAEEIVQNFFVQFWIKKENISINLSLKSYLFSSVRNGALNYIRDKKKLTSIDDNIEYLDSISYHESDENNIDLKDLNTRVFESIENLPQKCREIFKLSRMENLTYKEIAEKLSISQKTVENQIGIALKKLHENLKPYLEILLIICILISYF
jgi:RNA polymerase sigma-70 factor (ECF subfamily)